MSDETAANPEEGAGTTEANPRMGAEGRQETTEQEAVAAVAARLEPQLELRPTSETEQTPPAEPANQEAEPVRSTEGDDEPEVEPSTDDDPTTELTTEDGEELPDTLSGLADAIGMDEAELASHIKMPIKIGGETQMVSLADAANGQQMDADYRQKTTALADERRQFDGEKRQASQLLQQRLQAADERIATLSQQLDVEYPAEDMQRLATEDPAEYVRIKAQQDAQREALQGQRQAQEIERQRQGHEHQAEVGHYRESQQQMLVQQIPELTDPDKLEVFEKSMSTYLGEIGFTQDEVTGFVSGAFDHRQVLLIRDAMRYRGMQDKKKTITKKLKGLPRVQRPGTSPTRRRAQAGDDVSEARQRLSRDGATTEDAVGLVRRLLDG
jgi:hypothetical protein